MEANKRFCLDLSSIVSYGHKLRFFSALVSTGGKKQGLNKPNAFTGYLRVWNHCRHYVIITRHLLARSFLANRDFVWYINCIFIL